MKKFSKNEKEFNLARQEISDLRSVNRLEPNLMELFRHAAKNKWSTLALLSYNALLANYQLWVDFFSSSTFDKLRYEGFGSQVSFIMGVTTLMGGMSTF